MNDMMGGMGMPPMGPMGGMGGMPPMGMPQPPQQSGSGNALIDLLMMLASQGAGQPQMGIPMPTMPMPQMQPPGMPPGMPMMGMGNAIAQGGMNGKMGY